MWGTFQENARRLNKAFKVATKVVLFFSVNGSSAFQGYAQVTSMKTSFVPIWNSSATGNFENFDIRWLKM